MENMDKKPAAREDPIKDTPSLKAPITKSYLGKILRQSESEPTYTIPVEMIPIHQLLSITDNPFNTETLTENPIVTEINMIGFTLLLTNSFFQGKIFDTIKDTPYLKAPIKYLTLEKRIRQ